jgi:O2-independent ubiquinone biosynthesis accessory factor UbiT
MSANPVASRPALLTPLGRVLRTIPNAVHERVLSAMINHLLRGQPLADELAPLEGKRIRLSVSDTGSEITFAVRGRRLRPGQHGAEDHWDVRIRGALEDFWRLATRMEDPDTLFFHRRLDLEGETEAGLYVKNLLDSMEFDWEAHVRAVLGRYAGDAMIAVVRKAGLDRTVHHLLHAPTPPALTRR